LQQSKGDYWIGELWNATPYGYNDKIDSTLYMYIYSVKLDLYMIMC